jgi:hypothetical protein
VSGLDELDRRSDRVLQRKRTVPRPLHPVARGAAAETESVVSTPTLEALPTMAAAVLPTPDEPPAVTLVPDGVRDELGALHPMQIVADDATREALATLKARAAEPGDRDEPVRADALGAGGRG